MFITGIFVVASFEASSEDRVLLGRVQAFLVALFSTFFSFALVFCATCDDRFMGDTDGGVLRALAKCTGSLALCCAWGVMLLLGGLGLLFVGLESDSDYGAFITATLEALAWSWFVVWPAVNGFLLFTFFRWRELRALQAAGNTTQDGIALDKLRWWAKNEFPGDESGAAGISPQFSSGARFAVTALAPQPVSSPLESETAVPPALLDEPSKTYHAASVLGTPA
jgi:hypothetical protein